PLLHLVDYTFVPPVQFSPGSQTGDPFYLVVDDANIDGDPLQPGDELALFDGDSCVGAGMFDGNLPFVVRAYGFTEGNSYTVKAWDNSQYRYATAQVETYMVGQGNFVANGFNEINLSATVYVTNQITLLPNQFNLVSLNHYPQNPDASAVFGGIEGLEIVYDDEGRAFIPDYDINTIGSVDITEGYYLFFDSTGVNLAYTGLPISVSDWPLLLHAQRWNYFSYLKDQPADVSVVFASLADSIDIIQADDGGAWIPSLGINTLGNLTPGKGYTTFLTASTDQTFIYPATQGTLSRLLAEGPNPQHFVVEPTGLPHTVVIQEALFEGRPLEEGDEIGVFDGDRCVGAGVFSSKGPLVITAWQGNEELEVPGFAEGNPITFRIYSQKYSKEYPLGATFRREAESYFKNTPYTVVKRVNTSGGIIPDVYALGHNYPNPFNPLTRIPYQLPEDTHVRIAVYNLLGQEVVTLVNEFQLAAYHTAVWNGRDRNGREVPSGVYIYRMETPRFHKTQKLVLLK
ncbi:MAG: T9SS type A sorting domain-containing protein, partial [Fidelibacterota bacterium]